MKKFDRTIAKKLREEIDAALQGIAKKHDITIHAGSCSFNDISIKFKLEVKLNDKEVLGAKAKEDFETYATMFGFKKEDYQREFTVRGVKYTLEGFELNRSKFNVRGKEVGGEKVMLFVDHQIAKQMHPEGVQNPVVGDCIGKMFHFKAWVHPKHGGDDYATVFHIQALNLEDAKKDLEKRLSKISAVTKDYSQLTEEEVNK